MNKTLTYFKPKEDEAQWKKLYNAVRDREKNDLLSFGLLHSIVGYDIRDARGLIYRCNKELLQNGNKMLRSIRNVGYEIASSGRQMKQAANRKLRAKRQLDKGVLELKYLDVGELSAEERLRHTFLIIHYQTSLHWIRKRKIEALKETKKAAKASKKAVEIQEESIDRIDVIQEQLNVLKEQFSNQAQLN